MRVAWTGAAAALGVAALSLAPQLPVPGASASAASPAAPAPPAGSSPAVQPREAWEDRPVAVPKWTVPLSLHVAEEDGKPAQTTEWIEAQISEAQHQYAELDLAFRLARSSKLAAKHAALETRRDRDALRAYLERGVLDVFVVRLLRDVDAPPHEIHGVHWRPKGDERRHYVIVASVAGATTLAHELGHFFGLPHSKTKNNLMSYDRSSGRPPFLDVAQGKTVLAQLAISLRTKELLVLPAPSITP